MAENKPPPNTKSNPTQCHRCGLLSFDPSRLTQDQTAGHRLITPLDYVLEDEFPSLPILRASGNRGCSMCSFVRKVISDHCESDAVLSEVSRSSEEVSKKGSGQVAKSLRLVLDGYWSVGGEWLATRDHAQPIWISGRISLDNIQSAIRIYIMDDEEGKIKLTMRSRT